MVSGSVDSRGSGKSNCSRVSNVSRASKKAKRAGLKAEVEVLKNEGNTEIEEKVRLVKLETERFEREQKAALQEEIMIKENNILQEDHDLHASDNNNAADNTSEHKPLQPRTLLKLRSPSR